MDMKLTAQEAAAADDHPANEILIRLEDAAFRVGSRTILHHTNWEIRRGENWAVIGPNGAGKSTLLAALAGRTPMVAGRLERLTKTVQPDAVGYVAVNQQYILAAREALAAEARAWAGLDAGAMTVGDLLICLPAASQARRIADLLDIARLANRQLDRLSSGEWRRLLIVRALTPNLPRLLLLDEPFDGLDRKARQDMTGAIEAMIRTGVQVVMASHRRDELPPGILHGLHLDGVRVISAGQLNPGALANAFPTIRPTVPAHLPAPIVPARKAPPVLVELRAVTVRYGRSIILDRLTWRHRRDEHWAVLGPNGVGKTTLLRLITADHPQVYANDVRLMGRRRGTGETIHQVRAPIGMIGNELQIAYQRRITALAVVLSGFFDSIGLFRRPTSAQETLARQWLIAMGLDGKEQTDFRHLSYGQQRLVLIARAMIKAPLLLILDEPCEGLDGQNRHRVLARIDALANKGQTHILCVTHRIEDLPACISHVLHLAPNGGTRQETRKTVAAASGAFTNCATDSPPVGRQDATFNPNPPGVP